MNSLHALADRLLRVARAGECNTQQTAQNHATTHATDTQQGGLKALALLALARNNTRNTGATTGQKTTQQTPYFEVPFVARVEGDEPRNKTTPEKPRLLRGPEKLKPNAGAGCSPENVDLLRVARAGECNTQQSAQTRAVLHFRLVGHGPNEWATALGQPGESVESLEHDLRARWRVVEIRAPEPTAPRSRQTETEARILAASARRDAVPLETK